MTPDQEMQDAMRLIPWDSLSASGKTKIKGVISGHPIFRRMPRQRVYSDPEMFNFLLEHPDVVVAFWEKLGITQITLREVKDGDNRFLMKESTGTTALVEVLYRTADTCIVHGRGRYLGPFLAKSYDGEAVLVLRSRFQRDEHGEPFVVCDLDAFVRIDNVGADLFARLFATSLGKIADSNFEQTVAFVSHVSEAASINPESVRNLGARLAPVRDSVREDFVDVVDRVAMRSMRRKEPPLSSMYAEHTPTLSNQDAFAVSMPQGAPYAIPSSSVPLENASGHPDMTIHENPSFHTRMPPEFLFTFQADDKNETDPEHKAAPVPLPDPEQNASWERKIENVGKPALTGRVVFGTPKIAQQQQENQASAEK